MDARVYPSDQKFEMNRTYDLPIDQQGKLAVGGSQVSPDGTSVSLVSTVNKRWVDDFPGVALRSTKWGIEFNVGGMSTAVLNSDLVINTGVAANARISLLSKEVFTVPFDINLNMFFSQRIANQTFFVEAVEVDPITLMPVVNPNLASDWDNRAALKIEGTTPTIYSVDVIADGSNSVNAVASGSQITSATRGDHTLSIRAEEVSYSTQSTDLFAAKTPSARNSRQGLDPNVPYKIRLRAVNGAVAPASATTWTIGRVLVMDAQDISVNVNGGSGDSGNTRPVLTNVNTGPFLTDTQLRALSLPVSFGAVLATNNNKLVNRLVSGATINATIVKATAGRLLGGHVKNRTATERFLKLYNKITAPAPATDAALLVLTLAIPPNGELALNSILSQDGVFFAAGISFVIVAGLADNDATAVAAGDVVSHLVYA
jgi:hypothetical protein